MANHFKPHRVIFDEGGEPQTFYTAYTFGLLKKYYKVVVTRAMKDVVLCYAWRKGDKLREWSTYAWPSESRAGSRPKLYLEESEKEEESSSENS